MGLVRSDARRAGQPGSVRLRAVQAEVLGPRVLQRDRGDLRCDGRDDLGPPQPHLRGGRGHAGLTILMVPGTLDKILATTIINSRKELYVGR